MIAHTYLDEAFLKHETRGTNQDGELPSTGQDLCMLEVIIRKLAPYQLNEDLGDPVFHDSVLGEWKFEVKRDGWWCCNNRSQRHLCNMCSDVINDCLLLGRAGGLGLGEMLFLDLVIMLATASSSR